MTKADLLKYIDERLTQRSDGNIGLLMVRQYVADNMEEIPSVQPTQKNESNTLEALDCVGRKAAVDAIEAYFGDLPIVVHHDMVQLIKRLPSAQPEIIRCKDCKYRFVDGENVRFNVCELNHNKVQSDDWFCADGERRIDG